MSIIKSQRTEEVITDLETQQKSPFSADKNGQREDVKDSQPIAAALDDRPQEKVINSSVQLRTSQQLTPTPSNQPEPPKQEEKSDQKIDILSLLNISETENFDQAIQLVRSNQFKAAKSLLSQIKNQLKARLGASAESTFVGANFLFQRATLLPALISEFNGFNKVLPQDVQNHIPILVDSNLLDNTVKIHYELDTDRLVSDIYVQVGSKTVVQDIKLYVSTLKLMYRYWVISSRIRLLLHRTRSRDSQA